MKNSLRLAGAVLFAITSVACQGASNSLTAPTSSSSIDGAAAASSLLGASWRLVQIDGRAALTGVTVTAVFGAQNSLSGSGGCNRYTGTAAVSNGQISVGTLASTRMFCGPNGASVQEDAYFSSLAKVTSYTVVGAELRLHGPAGNAALVFVRE